MRDKREDTHMDISLITGITAGIIIGMLGILAAAGPKVQRRPIPIKEDSKQVKK